ncbi:DUF4190 domain-containing protein [uncultured Modestobacter sp.]|uniref:DUF4190 domain-containing protein n=1 Tax=uncultured Modestobacter sp. TaxID=380048 RepID=UPI0026276001|nr:DUF4190 domain-containing protein [uncultured Modestobacter sp.]
MSQLGQHRDSTAGSQQSNGLATAGMVCGIIAAATFWVPFLYLLSSLVLGIVAVVLSHKARSRAGGAGFALTGLVCGYAAIALSIANGVIGALAAS